jgi:homoserine/homoserine lactone efflux protein
MVIASHTLVEFASVWFFAAAFPGPNAVNCISMASLWGLRGAVAAISGILIVACFYVGVVWLVTDLIFSPASTFFISLAASFWLIYLGLKKLVSKLPVARHTCNGSKGNVVQISFSSVFRDSASLSIANPSVIGFYFSILSPFITDPNIEPFSIAFTLLFITGLIYFIYSLLGLIIHGRAYGVVIFLQKYRFSGATYVLIGCFFIYKAFKLN